MKIQDFLKLNGLPAKDKVTGFSGIVSSITFDLFGCILVLIQPEIGEDKKEYPNSRWFDINRVKITSSKYVMESPNYIERMNKIGSIEEYIDGAADKPTF